jgi:hypothetical protein
MPYRCSACSTLHYIPRALVVVCPICTAPVGERCRDLRSTDPGKHRITEHAERLELLP